MSIGVHAQAPTVSRGTSSTTPARTTTNGSTVILIGCLAADTWGATPVQDSKSNTWTQVGTTLTTGVSGLEMRVYKAVNITGGSGHTFTINPGSNGFPALLMVEILGAPASPTITNDRQADTSSPYTSPSIAPATTVTLIGGIFTDAPSGTETDTWGGSFASGDKIEEISDADTSLTGSMAAADKAAGTYNGSVTVSGVTITDSGNWIIAVETSGGGGGGASVEANNFGSRRNRPGRGPYSLGKYFRPRIDAFTTINQISGTASPTLGSLTLSSTAALDIFGTVSKTLGALTLASTGTISLSGVVNATLGALTSAATATLLDTGTLSSTLQSVSLSSTGQLLIQATLTQTLGALTLVSDSTISSGPTGTLAQTLANATLNATATLDIQGSVTVTLDSLTLSNPSQSGRAAGGDDAPPRTHHRGFNQQRAKLKLKKDQEFADSIVAIYRELTGSPVTRERAREVVAPLVVKRDDETLVQYRKRQDERRNAFHDDRLKQLSVEKEIALRMLHLELIELQHGEDEQAIQFLLSQVL